MNNNDHKCKRPGCAGRIVDGFCADCGRAPAGKVVSAMAGGVNHSVVSAPVSGTNSAVSGASQSRSSRSGRSSNRSGRISSRRVLGAGLVTLPPLPSLDPLQAIMPLPVVPDHKRYCGACQAKLNHEKGFCPMCGHDYCFSLTLKPGDVVAEQFEVKGPIAFGGLGWIYLAWDNTLGRWVVLKGLLNSKNEASAAAAVAERQFLAAVKHPKIVGIYNFVTRGTEGYIVMEYVGGKSLKAIRQERGALPVAEAIAYIHAILPAFSYLQRMGMVYCDFKPDNFMLEGDDVKLIDMGGVRRVDDPGGDIYGTKGYSAPEASDSPSFASDLYSIARTLAVLIIDFKFQAQFEFSLPEPAAEPVFRQHDSLYRFMLKATRNDPDERFQTADEMADQLIGVLRDVVAETGPTKSIESSFFGMDMPIDPGPDGRIILNHRAVPTLKVDPLDEAANSILAAGAANRESLRGILTRIVERFPASSEARLRLADALIDVGSFLEAERLLLELESKDPFDWRPRWYRGQMLLADQSPKAAVDAFNWVYSELPGEIAPKLALAVAAEKAADLQTAIQYYDLVSRADANFTSAAFGLARCLSSKGDRTAAVAAYRRVPPSSAMFLKAQMALTRVLLQAKPTAPGENELIQASETIQGLALDEFTLHKLSADLFLEAIAQMDKRLLKANSTVRLLGQPLQLDSLRRTAERELRACARFTHTAEERIALIDQANRVRPRTLF